MTRLRRLSSLLAVLVLPALAAVPAPSTAQETGDPLRVYVLVTDGLEPAEVTPEKMPRLAALREQSTWYEEAGAVLIAETAPNHVAMATGMLPRNNGIVGNTAFDPTNPDAGDHQQDDPAMLTADTTVTRLERDCASDVSTATILSKTYLFNVFSEGGDQQAADFHWNAEPFYIPESDHALDDLTMDQLRRWVFLEQPPTPQLAFVNLGDIDRSGHIDPTGNALDGEYPAGRSGAMAHTDALIGNFIDALTAQGWWEDTVLIVASDHGMDYSLPDRYVDFNAALADAGMSVGFDVDADHVGVSENGGAALIYVHDPSRRSEVARVLEEVEGVDRVLSRTNAPRLADYGLDHPRAGDFVALVEAGWRVASGDLGRSNPIPGNHGHAITQHSVLMVSGSHDALADTPSSVPGDPVYEPDGPLHRPVDGPGNLSIAPTVNSLFGLDPPPGRYDGQPLREAFGDLTGRICAASIGPGGGGAGKGGERDDAAANAVGGGAGAGAPVLPATGGGLALAGALLIAGSLLVAQRRRR